MSCKNDQDWESSYVYKQQCVQWYQLVTLREKFNEFWDLLKKEEKQNSVKYGYRSNTDKSAQEQTTNDLATINGFCSVRFNEAGNYDEIYFKITSGSILQRLNGLGSSYSYANPVGGQVANYGPWIVYLKDPCYGCTGYRFQNADIPYRRSIVCNDISINNIDSDAWKAQCIWPSCTGSGTVISDWQQYCHFNFDWRSSYAEKFGDVAKKLFAKEICAPFGDPCTVSRNYCCNEYALAHYTEEFMNHSLCPQNETAIATGSPLPYRKRRLKWVSLGVTLTNPLDEEQPFDDDTFFCCSNSITGGVFEGHVTQKISAIHLTDMWDRINTMVGSKPLRKCFYNQCKYYQENDKKYRWLHKQSVPMYAGGSTPDMMDRKDTCQNCDRTSVGANICACNFNDINALLDEYLAMECSCEGESKYKGESLVSVGSVEDCNCCKTKCCCDCKCEDDITQEECLKKSCKKNGPKWLGVYEKGDSKDDKKMGDNKPCGCWEGGDEPDPKFPDVSCMEICGESAACCDPKTCECSTKTKCECDDDKGEWQGFRTSDGSYKNTTWKKGDPKNCGDDDIKEKIPCGALGACCGNAANSEDCYCTEITKCECDDRKGSWKGVDTKCEDFTDEIPGCGQNGKCCIKDESGYECTCTVTTKCSCDASDGTWTPNGNCDTPCPNLPKGRCCESGSCNCSGDCPGSDCTPEDGCCCDGLCYTSCNDCCDFTSARACCSGFLINSLFEDVNDYDTSVYISEDQTLSDLHKMHSDYAFITNAFDMLLMNSMYIHETASIKLSNYSRLIYLQILISFYELYIENGGVIPDKILDTLFEQNAQSSFYYAQSYRNSKKTSSNSEKIKKDLFTEFSLMRSSVFAKLKELKLV
jgi:hypothetical protein